MSEKDSNPNEKTNHPENKNRKPVSHGRREAIKALATVPVLGAMAYGVYRKKKQETRNITSANMFHFNSEISPLSPLAPDGKTIRLGIIGSGIRGKQLMIALGFGTPQYVEDLKQAHKQDSSDNRYQDFREQEDLKIVITAVCDIFDVHAEEAIAAGANIHREGLNGQYGAAPRRYRHYRELLAADDVDAVVIAAPDHWHGQMALDAARAGKHVYL
ncbi:MAG: Gfo/Idh/MocA family oxidoreductase, partial [Proteiniphilum sp.]|nr:Gfo/Idh/MocA family oxidoreductase [Proteiniphilum sp.]